MASHNLSQSPRSGKSPISKSGVLTIQGFGVRVQMQSGHLEIEDGVGIERRRLRLPRVNHRLKRLVCIGDDGFVTLAALRWLSDVGVSFVMLDRVGKVRVVTGPASPSEAKLRRAQALALGNGNAVQIAPQKTDPGPVDETVTYTLNATNECGGTASQTATLHITGSIEGPPELAMRSVYFETNIPTAQDAQNELLPSEQETLKSIAESFNRYVAITPGAKLTLSGHADKRGSTEYNQALSERRAQLVKAFLTEQGISADALDVQALGEEQNLSPDDVKQLMQHNPNLNDEQRQQEMWRLKTLVLANNRRVDISLSPTGQQSVRQYPYNAEDFARLIDRNGPSAESTVQFAAKKEKISN